MNLSIQRGGRTGGEHPRLPAALLSAAFPLIAAPVFPQGGAGDSLFAGEGRVKVQAMPSDAGYTRELWLESPGTSRSIATNRQTGTVVNLGRFPKGEELLRWID